MTVRVRGVALFFDEESCAQESAPGMHRGRFSNEENPRVNGGFLWRYRWDLNPCSHSPKPRRSRSNRALTGNMSTVAPTFAGLTTGPPLLLGYRNACG